MCHPGHISRNKSDRRVLKKSQGRPYKTSCNIFYKSLKQIDVDTSPKNIELYTIQAVMCHPGHISRNKNDRQVLKKSQGRPYETSSNIFCKRLKQIKLYTIQAVMYYPGHISRNKSDRLQFV